MAKDYLFWGREPAALAGVLQAFVALALASNVVNLSGDQVGLGMAFVAAGAGGFVAWRTKHVTLAILVGLANAAVALGAGFGLALPAGQTAAAIGVITVLFGFFNRTQTSPAVPDRAGVV